MGSLLISKCLSLDLYDVIHGLILDGVREYVSTEGTFQHVWYRYLEIFAPSARTYVRIFVYFD